MSRYVDIEGDWVDDAVKAYSLGYYDDDEYAIPFERFDSAPSIDLVRCGECRYYRDYDGCFFSTEFVDADGFCSYGERREDE